MHLLSTLSRLHPRFPSAVFFGRLGVLFKDGGRSIYSTGSIIRLRLPDTLRHRSFTRLGVAGRVPSSAFLPVINHFCNHSAGIFQDKQQDCRRRDTGCFRTSPAHDLDALRYDRERRALSFESVSFALVGIFAKGQASRFNPPATGGHIEHCISLGHDTARDHRSSDFTGPFIRRAHMAAGGVEARRNDTGAQRARTACPIHDPSHRLRHADDCLPRLVPDLLCLSLKRSSVV